jgi:hypothetical protein
LAAAAGAEVADLSAGTAAGAGAGFAAAAAARALSMAAATARGSAARAGAAATETIQAAPTSVAMMVPLGFVTSLPRPVCLSWAQKDPANREYRNGRKGVSIKMKAMRSAERGVRSEKRKATGAPFRAYLRTVARPPPGVQIGHRAQPRAAVPQF